MVDHKVFKEDRCSRCGECFTRCQYMDLSRREAIAEIKRLIEGRPTRVVHKKCVSCYACNAFCPEDAVVASWSECYAQNCALVEQSVPITVP